MAKFAVTKQNDKIDYQTWRYFPSGTIILNKNEPDWFGICCFMGLISIQIDSKVPGIIPYDNHQFDQPLYYEAPEGTSIIITQE